LVSIYNSLTLSLNIPERSGHGRQSCPWP
jgi:hypothetical protein